MKYLLTFVLFFSLYHSKAQSMCETVFFQQSRLGLIGPVSNWSIVLLCDCNVGFKYSVMGCLRGEPASVFTYKILDDKLFIRFLGESSYLNEIIEGASDKIRRNSLGVGTAKMRKIHSKRKRKKYIELCLKRLGKEDTEIFNELLSTCTNK